MLRIITDSASDYTFDELKQLNVEMICLNVTFGSDTFKETLDISKEDFFKRLLSDSNFPITSQPSPNDILEILEDAKSKNDEVLGIFLSSKVSGTYNTCVMMKNTVEIKNCYFLDSLSGSAGEKILVNEACKMRDSGASLDDIVKRLESIKTRIKYLIAGDSLDYLAKGGRISALATKLGNLLKFKPIVSVVDGNTVLYSKPRGIKSAIEEIVLAICNDKVDKSFPIYGLYTPSEDNIDKLIDALALSGIKVDYKHFLGAIIGSHIGPNAFGLVYISADN